jgi:methyltransferase (TIGR00027 family)
MSDDSIQHVSDTALWVATYRAIETERPDALFKDPLAAQLVGERGRRIAERMKSGGVVQWAVVIRTCIIDDLITKAIAEGVDTVLNLGAGLDTRPYRMELPATLRWIEVDYPHLQEYKTERLGGAQPCCVLERISLDLGQRAARRELFARVNTQAKKVLVLTEGVTPYLSNEEVGELADDLHACQTFQLWVLDYNSSANTIRGFGHRRMRDKLKNAPFKFHPPDWIQFFVDHRWQVKEMRYYVDESERTGRRFKLSWWLILRILFIPRKKRREMRKWSGFAVLEPQRT